MSLGLCLPLRFRQSWTCLAKWYVCMIERETHIQRKREREREEWGGPRDVQ